MWGVRAAVGVRVECRVGSRQSAKTHLDHVDRRSDLRGAARQGAVLQPRRRWNTQGTRRCFTAVAAKAVETQGTRRCLYRKFGREGRVLAHEGVAVDQLPLGHTAATPQRCNSSERRTSSRHTAANWENNCAWTIPLEKHALGRSAGWKPAVSTAVSTAVRSFRGAASTCRCARSAPSCGSAA